MAGEFAPTTGVAGRYAGALFDLAKEAGAVAAVEAEMNALSASIDASLDLRDFLKSPIYDRADQIKALTALAQKAGFGALTTNFLKLVATNRRLFALPAMIAGFAARAAADRGEVSAEAISAAAMSEDQTKALRLEIESMVGKAVNLETSIDPDLLGGLIVKIGSQMIDSSLRTKLNRLRTVMKEA
ncbi:MAG: F0F1 ATP synthase subunit delta [Alphaproteobacteria bacterium]|nr:F0F1 ATP synthase subunit delta [Alphaproteobacteria bacterium]